MKTSRRILITFSAVILFIQCTHPRHETHDFSIRINSIENLKKDTLDGIDNIYYSINFDLINHTDSTIHFWMMTCSWNDNFIFNIKNVYVMYPFDCTRNFPTVMIIDKNQKMNFKGVIGTTNTANLKQELKLGFIYIKENEKSRLNELLPSPPNDSGIIRRATPKQIIWTNPFRIDNYITVANTVLRQAPAKLNS